MKLTWFGGTTLRVYIGGQIVVIDALGAPAGIDQQELTAGADHSVALAAPDVLVIDPSTWKPKPPTRLMDEATQPELLTAGPGTLVIDAPGEPPLLVTNAADLPHIGRWANGAVFLLVGHRGIALAGDLLARHLVHPRLIILAADETTIETAVARLADHLDGTSLVSLEPGLALEV